MRRPQPGCDSRSLGGGLSGAGLGGRCQGVWRARAKVRRAALERAIVRYNPGFVQRYAQSEETRLVLVDLDALWVKTRLVFLDPCAQVGQAGLVSAVIGALQVKTGLVLADPCAQPGQTGLVFADRRAQSRVTGLVLADPCTHSGPTRLVSARQGAQLVKTGLVLVEPYARLGQTGLGLARVSGFGQTDDLGADPTGETAHALRLRATLTQPNAKNVEPIIAGLSSALRRRRLPRYDPQAIVPRSLPAHP